MKVAIHYSVDVSPIEREALAHRIGKDGLASREDIQKFYAENGTTFAPPLLAEHLIELYRTKSDYFKAKADKLEKDDT